MTKGVYEGFWDRIHHGELERGKDLAACGRAFALELDEALAAGSLTGRQVIKLWRHYLRHVRTDEFGTPMAVSRGIAAAASARDEAAGIINRLRGRFRSDRYRGADRRPRHKRGQSDRIG